MKIFHRMVHYDWLINSRYIHKNQSGVVIQAQPKHDRRWAPDVKAQCFGSGS